MSVLGSVFLGLLAAAPTAVESITHLTALRGFAGTSVLILVGVAQDTARKVPGLSPPRPCPRPSLTPSLVLKVVKSPLPLSAPQFAFPASRCKHSYAVRLLFVVQAWSSLPLAIDPPCGACSSAPSKPCRNTTALSRATTTYRRGLLDCLRGQGMA